jgi:DeoR/GlpR family transcriptional regulator of sugar metabolism
MLARQRQSVIVEELRRAGSARVSELTQALGVSDMTVRRDLDVLAGLERLHLSDSRVIRLRSRQHLFPSVKRYQRLTPDSEDT